MPRPKGLPKTGGKVKGSKNRPKVEVLPPETAKSIVDETARAVVLTSAPVRTPKAVMLEAMTRFENLGLGLLMKAERLTKRNAKLETIAETAREGHKYIVAAVECATKVAPYIHARLLAVEARGDTTEDRAPFVVRVPAVAVNSSEWQMAVGVALLAQAADEAPQSPPGHRPEAAPHPGLPRPPEPTPPPAPAPAVLAADPKSGRITMMPAVAAPAKPAGTDEWLAQVTADRRKAG